MLLASDKAELAFCPGEPRIEFLQVSLLPVPASLVLIDALAKSWQPSHECHQRIVTEHLLCARACTAPGSQWGAPHPPSLASHASFPALLLSCDLRPGSHSKFYLQTWAIAS